MRLLFYATNGLGLGHVTRLLTIIRAIRRQDPSHEILFLTRCEAGPYPKEDDVFTLRIPGPVRARSSGLTPKSYYQMVHLLLWQAASSFDPHLLVVDTFPSGPEGELVPLMKWPIRKAFVYRDSRADVYNSPDFRKSLDPYQMILVAHDAGTVPLPDFLTKDPRVHFTGIISEGTGQTDDWEKKRNEVRDRLGLSDEPTALVTMGGGGDPEAMRILPMVTGWFRKNGVPFLVATGPLLREIPPCITAREWFPAWPLAPWLPGFDMAVASAGYNTVSELSAVKIPALLIPFARDLDDQEKRVSETLGEGWAIQVPSTAENDLFDGLSRLIDKCSRPIDRGFPSPHQTGIVDDRRQGAHRAAELLLSYLPRKDGTNSPLTPSDREPLRAATL
jgi:UDP-N-acetylglucosamine:LPS N-acetylglucosamine transferase